MKSIKIATVQFNHKPGDKNYNLSVIESFCRQVAAKKAKMVVFPEMCITGYWHVRNLSKKQIAELAENLESGESIKKLQKLSEELNIMIGAGLIEKTKKGKLYNTYVVLSPDGKRFSHRKLHCFISPFMDSGNEYTVFETPFGFKAGILICYDNNIIENVRITALMGADVIIAPHQTGGCNSRSPFSMKPIDPKLWENRQNDPMSIEKEIRGPNGREWLMRWLPSRAHDNGVFLIFSNGIGYDDGEVRTGNAMVIDCYGRIINETSQAKDDIVFAEIDLTMLEKCTGRRWIRGRRPDLYELISKKTGNELEPRAARFSEQ
ncbi:MAG: nitrilase family protein [Calditrichaeota bacterium]|nr:nitrilase family protein [Calditrichota bacterium]